MVSVIKRRRWVWFIIGLIWSGSCEQNPVSVNGLRIIQKEYKGALIINEGHFQQGDASLSYFDVDSQLVYQNVFKQINGEDLGDVANSIYIRDSLAYIVINNSDKIEIIDTRSFKRHRKINLPAGTSPRHLAISGNSELMITSLYGGKVLSVDPESGSIIAEIPVGKNPEELLLINEKAFVANSGFGSGHTISVIGLPGFIIRPEIGTGDNPRFLRLDKSSRIHVLCSGAYNDWSDPEDDTPGGIWVIDPETETVSDSLVFAAGIHPGKFDISAAGIGFVIKDNGILTYDSETLAVIEDNLIGSRSMTPYALRFSNNENLLYILDAVDYISAGKLWIYDPEDSDLRGPYPTGAIPGDLAFIFEQVDE